MKSSSLLLCFGLLLTNYCVAGFIAPSLCSHFACPLSMLPQPENQLTSPAAVLPQRRRTILSLVSKEKEEGATDPLDYTSSNGGERLSDLFDKLAFGFPFYILLSVAMGLFRPSTLLWVNQAILIKTMLAATMAAVGLSLRPQDFLQIRKENSVAVTIGVLCEFIIMPVAAFIVGRAFFGHATSNSLDVITAPTETQKSLFLGLCLLGAAPGASASNLVATLANVNVALSVILTTCSTVLSVLLSPILVKLMVGRQLNVSILALVDATLRYVLLPVALGMRIRSQAPRIAQMIARWTPLASVSFVSLVCGGAVAQNAALLLTSGGSHHITLALCSVLLLHVIGFDAGYLVAKTVLGRKQKHHNSPDSTCEAAARTVSLQVGMQSSAFAVVMARSMGAPTLACLPAVLSSAVHPFLASLLATFWKWRDRTDHHDQDGRR